MALLSAFLLMAQSPAPGRIDVPILHRRPSKVVAILRTLPSLEVGMWPDDAKGTIGLSGAASDIAEARSRIALFDVAPRTVEMRLLLENPLDRAEWKADVTMTNNQAWTGADQATGTSLALVPRLNDDGTATLSVETTSADTPKLKFVVRLEPNEPLSFGLDPKAKVGSGAMALAGARVTLIYVRP